jgi:hypothetical protein
MCWSKFEREEWQREREAERLREISSTEPKVEEPEEPEVEVDEREDELVHA